jgi:hypothetical protein
MMRFLEEGRQCVRQIETTIPVHTWQVGGISIWPFTRMLVLEEFYMKEILSQKKVLNSSVHTSATWQRKWQSVQKLLVNLYKWLKASWIDRQGNANTHSNYDVVFLREGTSNSYLDGRFYCKFANPILGFLEEQGFRGLLLEPLNNYYTPRYRQSVFIQPRLEYEKIKSKVMTKILGTVLPEELSGYDQFLEVLQEHGIPVRLFEFRERQQQILALLTEARYFEVILKKTKARAGIILDINLTNFAFLIACSRLSLPTTYVFHGAFDVIGPFYADWVNIPAEGYHLLPTVFWTWNENNRQELLLWTNKTTRHIAVMGGNPFISMWQKGSDPLVKTIDEVLKQYTDQQKDIKCHILISLSYALDDILGNTGITAEQLRAITLAPKTWRWWLRLHPTQLQYIPELCSLLDKHAITNVEIEHANKFPLPCLLKNIIDVHVTTVSSTATECALFDISTVLTHPIGEQVYPNLINSGRAVMGLRAEDIITHIQKFCATGRADTSYHTIEHSVDYNEAYQALVRMAEGAYVAESSRA